MQLTAEQSARLLEIARDAIRRTLRRQPLPTLPQDDPALMQPAGCFVSLHELGTHRLRGCVGRLDASGPLVAVVQQTAVNVLGDPRFTNNTVRLEELPRLSIEISVLSPLMPAASPLDFDLLNDGIYLIISNRSGCFLPQVARETGWSKEQLLDRLCTEKMGFPARMWQHPAARLQKFTSTILGPEAFERLDARIEC
jgi:AmmeMemoRadiSam system protein A